MSARTNRSAKAAGTRHATAVAAYLAEHLGDDRIERRALMGSHDRGDVTGVRHNGNRVVIEAKDYRGEYHVGPWLEEADEERVNDGAQIGLVVAKRRGRGDPGDQVVFMTLRDLIALMQGERPL